jgi:hypothetical protein
MKSYLKHVAAIAAFCVLSAAVFAADPSGTWKWTTTGMGGRGGGGGGDRGGAAAQPREQTLTLVAKGGKVTGKLSAPGRGGEPMVVDITNGTVKGDTVSFTVEREFQGNRFVARYSGKVQGDTIKGTIEMPGRDGQTRSVDWEAKRTK